MKNRDMKNEILENGIEICGAWCCRGLSNEILAKLRGIEVNYGLYDQLSIRTTYDLNSAEIDMEILDELLSLPELL